MIKISSLAATINGMGILTLNSNLTMPNVIDLGYTWQDVTSLINAHEIFYSKAYKKRTTYLSKLVYYLLKEHQPQKPLTSEAQEIYELLEGGPLSTKELKTMTFTKAELYQDAFNFLLEQRYITAYATSKELNPNWSTFIYCTASYWEEVAGVPPLPEETLEKLKAILIPSMGEKACHKFLR